jgi:hypothetical protein
VTSIPFNPENPENPVLDFENVCGKSAWSSNAKRDYRDFQD